MKKSIISTAILAIAFALCGCFSTTGAKGSVPAKVEVKAKKADAKTKSAVKKRKKNSKKNVVKADAAKPEPAYKVTIHLAGDSTCANYAASSALTGWGQVLNEYCKSDVRVNNMAKSGCSTQSFIYQKRWDALIDSVKPGDYVIVQFGHNDGKKDKRFADAKTTYSANLKKFIADIRARKANPVIATSISRCVFKKGKIAPSGLDRYREAAIAVAKAENVPVIDLNRITADKFNAMGEEKAFAYFRGTYGVAPAKKKQPAKTNAKQPKKRTDRTHLKRNGALEVSGWFVADCKAQKLPIANCFK